MVSRSRLSYKAENEWPKNIITYQDIDEEELRSNYVNTIHHPEQVIDFKRFSKWERLLRAMAYVIKAKNQQNDKSPKFTNELSSKILKDAETLIFKMSQLESYPDEITQLQSNSNYKIDRKSPIFKMSPFIDQDGLLRVRGRIDAASEVSLDTKRPIILPPNHYVTQLIISYYHRRYHHWNHETAINEIRQKYSISRLRIIMRTIKAKYCQDCKNNKSKPIPPEMGNLPASRLSSFTRPFSFVGIDYFGPMFVVVGRRTEKRWGMLITCLTVRAIHIEIVHSLTTDSCIMGLRNFMSRRGEVIEIWSDNATTFTGAANELAVERQKIDDNKMQQAFTSTTTAWKFIPPSSPHMGGAWARLVRSVKQVMMKIMPTRNPTDELLRCVLMEAERVVNSRPLTYIPIETENDEALTPNHFLLGSSSGIKPTTELDTNVLLLRKNWHKAQHLADHFWKRWVKEYLPTLTRRTKWFDQVKPIEELINVMTVEHGQKELSLKL